MTARKMTYEMQVCTPSAPGKVLSGITNSTAGEQAVDNSAASEDEALKRLYLPKEEYLAGLPEQVSVLPL